VKKLIFFFITLTFVSSKPAFSQEAFKVGLNQLPPLIITISEEINAAIGKVVNLDTCFHVEGDLSYYRMWMFWDGVNYSAIDDPILTLPSTGVFYLTVIDENWCTTIDTITLSVITHQEDIYIDKENNQSIRVYPNPNTGSFDILISDCQQGYSIHIFSSLGVQLLNRSLDCNNNEYSGKIIMPTREPGLYFLLVKQGNKNVYSQKVIILK